MNFEEYVNEALKVKYVVRNNRKVKKYKTTRPGKYRVEYDENGKPKEVRITATERRNRKIGQRKGKIKRAAKMNLIKLRQEKSFRARKNMGMAKYNKKNPDKNIARDGENPKKVLFSRLKSAVKKDKLLAPKFEGYCSDFQDYLKESLLLEWPEGIIWSDYKNNIDIGWDFCQEKTENGEWLRQLVTLYKYRYLKTLSDDRNKPFFSDGFLSKPYLEFSVAQLEDITNNLCTDWGFISTAHFDLKLIQDKNLLDDLEKYIPERLWKKIIEYKEK